jgi:anti-sigma factor RsiW
MDRSLQHAFDAEEVMAYLDGELEPQRAAALAGHLEHCAECQDVAKELRLVSGRMMNFEIELAPANLTVAALFDLSAAEAQKPPKVSSPRRKILARWREFFATQKAWAFAGGFAILVALAVIASPQLLVLSRVPWRAEQRMYDAASPAAPRPGATESNDKSWMQKDAADLQRSQEAMLSESMVRAPAASQPAAEPGPPPPDVPEKPQALESVGPMIVQTASLSIVAKNYDEANAAIDRLAKARGGYVEKLDAKAQTGNARELSIALRIPAKQLDGFLADLRQLGHVEQESQSNEEVSAEYVDLQARLRSAQATERRLIELLATRTGKLEDVLEVERELARVRGEIESMQGQSAVLVHRVSYATVQVELSEEYHEKLQSGASTGMKLRNAAIEGIQNLRDGIVSALILVLNEGPAFLFWLLLLLGSGLFVWRRFRARRAAQN